MFISHAGWGRQIHDNYAAGCGILLHAPLKRVRDGVYRLGLGYNRVIIPRTTRLASDYDDTYRLNLTNLLAYSFYHRNKISLRVGPQIAFSVVSGRVHSKYQRDLVFIPWLPSDLRIAILLKDTLNRHKSYTDLILSLAPVIGLDINPDELFTVSLNAGFRGGVYLKTKDPGSDFRYEGFGEASVMLRIKEDPAREE
jgi:hypothetical protein